MGIRKKILFSFRLQGGMYVFQMFDYYACNGGCILFLCMFESLALGWIFGENGYQCVWIKKKKIQCKLKINNTKKLNFFFTLQIK